VPISRRFVVTGCRVATEGSPGAGSLQAGSIHEGLVGAGVGQLARHPTAADARGYCAVGTALDTVQVKTGLYSAGCHRSGKPSRRLAFVCPLVWARQNGVSFVHVQSSGLCLGDATGSLCQAAMISKDVGR
jgi:hypothetical protein